MHTHRTLYVLLATLLSVVLLIAAPVTSPVFAGSPSPTPDHSWYPDWSGEGIPGPIQAHLGPVPSELAAQGISPQMIGCSALPSPLRYIAYVYTEYTLGTNEDIYVHTCACGSPTTRLTTSPKEDYDPHLSKDGKKIVFVSLRDGNRELYSMSINGGTQTRLTINPGYDGNPAFSPDGSQVVFSSQRENGSVNIYVMNANGTGVKRLTTAKAEEHNPDWSPDGKKIAFVRRSSDIQNNSLYIMNADGSNQHAILSNRYRLGRPIWSPKGDRLAFMYASDGSYWTDLALINADGTGLTNLPIYVENGVDLLPAGWFHDESALIYSAYLFHSDTGSYSTTLHQYTFATLSSDDITLMDYPLDVHAVSLDVVPPTSSLSPLPEWTRVGDPGIHFTASDNYDGVASVDLQYRTEKMPNWATVATENAIPVTSGTFLDIFSPVVGQKVYYRAIAVDYANNRESDQKLAETWTRVFDHLENFLVTDVREKPLTNQPVAISQGTMDSTVTGADGQVTVHMKRADHNITFARPGYGDLPEIKFTQSDDADRSIQAVLPGPDEIITNGFFNNMQSPFYGWQRTPDSLSLAYTNPRQFMGKAVVIGNCSGTGSTCPANGHTLSQSISLPDGMYNPTLSFYFATAYGSSAQSTFEVSFTPQGGQPVTLFSQPAYPSQASQHAWVDMSPYLGQTGTLTFRLNRAADDLYQKVYLEEVSLSSWNTPFLTSAGPLSILAGAADGTWIDLDGENFAPAAQVFLGSQEITTLERTGSTHIRFQLPVGIPTGSYDLHIVNPGGAEARPERPLWVGYFTYQPSVIR